MQVKGGAERAWRTFRSWPRWAQVTAWAVVGLLVVSAIGTATENGDETAGPTTTQATATTEPTTTTEATTTTEEPDLEEVALTVTEEVFGDCLRADGLEDWQDAAVVRTATEVEGVVTVEVFAISVGTGREFEYQFRVNTGLGSYAGIPNPGAGIPVNDEASALVGRC